MFHSSCKIHLFLALIFLTALVFSGCRANRVIRNNGLKFVKIGDEMPESGQKRWQGRAVRDTLFEQGGYNWRALVLSYKDGKVYVEEDFWGQNQVNRIRIESPALQVAKGIKVGMTMAELRTYANSWEAIFLQEYGVLDLIRPNQPSIHYLVREPDATPHSTELPISIDKIPDESRVVAIVVM